jgi:hypothetical protein
MMRNFKCTLPSNLTALGSPGKTCDTNTTRGFLTRFLARFLWAPQISSAGLTIEGPNKGRITSTQVLYNDEFLSDVKLSPNSNSF